MVITVGPELTTIRAAAHPLTVADPKYASLLDLIGDARATQMGEEGELNVGQLVRERAGGDAVLVGFSTDHGWVTAASEWDQPPERKRVRPALDGSYERLFHAVAADGGAPNFLLRLRDRGEVAAALRGPLLERAIGVVYLPETEHWSHYVAARLPEQFDAIVQFDETSAVAPLERTAGWEAGEPPEPTPPRSERAFRAGGAIELSRRRRWWAAMAPMAR